MEASQSKPRIGQTNHTKHQHPETMKNNDLFNATNSATYCPEDDKIRLYVGRVPRPEFEALRAEGWTSTQKQACDFAAVWTAAREETALSYAGEIDDEDQDPADRAADRAERFLGYRDRRESEATGHADQFNQASTVHGYQSQQRADRAAARHDKHAAHAVTQWNRAEYWTSRTAGVISNALYKSRPDVRMGRIKTLEAELRKIEKDHTKHRARLQGCFDALQSVVDHDTNTAKKMKPACLQSYRWSLNSIMNHDNPDATEETKATPEQIRRATVCSSLETCYRSHEGEKEARKGTRPAVDVARDYLADRTRPEDWKIKNSRTAQHITNRLAYEWQMLEAQGGRAALVEMVKGGTLAGMVIHKLNKSNATGRTVSVDVITRENKLHSIQTERLAENAYNEPTEESLARLAEFEALLSAHKKALPKAPPLINPTLADAQKLQDIINERHAAKWQKHHGKPSEHYKPKAGEVAKMTQAQYSAAAAGSYARHETKEFHAMGEVKFGGWNSSAHRAQHGTIICKLRATGYDPINLIHITDKPSKPLPAEMFQTFNHGHTPEALAPRAREIVEATAARNRTPEQQALALAAEVAGLAKGEHMTEEGHNWARELGAYNAPAAPTPTAAPFTLTA